MNIKEFLEAYLMDKGYDGLINNSYFCSCTLLEGICECGKDFSDCELTKLPHRTCKKCGAINSQTEGD